MMKNQSKSIKILEELIRYFTFNGIKDLTIRFTSTREALSICVSGETEHPPRDIADLERLIQTPRKPEFEESYWGLLGSSGTRNEMSLLGSLVDAGHVTYENGTLMVKVERRE